LKYLDTRFSAIALKISYAFVVCSAAIISLIIFYEASRIGIARIDISFATFLYVIWALVAILLVNLIAYFTWKILVLPVGFSRLATVIVPSVFVVSLIAFPPRRGWSEISFDDSLVTGSLLPIVAITLGAMFIYPFTVTFIKWLIAGFR